ncbi:MAG: hypothetical protein BRD23_06105 [Halobacteriales archaeon SW_9_67_25]|nr:MAG: hypothetical protein BRD23_06105 [Halobacteriales archaeon SW_9_67_25]
MAPMLAMGGIILAAVNAVLLAVLGAVWVRNYRQFRSGMVLGLVVFSGALLVENVVAVYFFFHSMHMFYASDPFVGSVVFVMRGLEFVAVGLLAAVTVR